jgi:hypothetical protein
MARFPLIGRLRRRRRPSFDPIVADARPVLRTYLYVDSDQVLTALSSFHGGQIDEIRRTIVREGAGNIGIKLPAWLAQIDAGAKGSRRVEDQIVIKPMVESALTMLLDRLENKQKVGPGGLSSLREGQLIEFQTFLSVLPGGEVQGLPPIPDEFPTLWRNWFLRLFMDPDPDELRVFTRMQNLSLGTRFVAIADAEPPTANQGVLLNLRAKYVLVDDPDDFGRAATVVGHVRIVPRESERLNIEKDALGTVARAGQLSPQRNPPPPVQHARAVVAPLCIYR